MTLRAAACTTSLLIPTTTVVFDDADLDKMVEWLNGGIFYNMGYVDLENLVEKSVLTCQRQNCCASSRVYVQESIHETFLSNSFHEPSRTS